MSEYCIALSAPDFKRFQEQGLICFGSDGSATLWGTPVFVFGYMAPGWGLTPEPKPDTMRTEELICRTC